MPTLDQAVNEFTEANTPEKPKDGFLGAFVAGSFQTTVTTDPSLTWMRDESNQTTTAKHHGRVNLAITDNNVPIQYYHDENGDLAIYGTSRDQGGAVYEGDSGFAVAPHTHAASDIVSGALAAARGGLGTSAAAFTGLLSFAAGVASAITTLTGITLDADNNTVSNIGAAETKADLISGRTEITSVDTANDFLPIWDATDSAIKKVLPEQSWH